MNIKSVPPILGFIFVIIILILALRLPCEKSDIINFGLFISTVALAVIAYSQLKALREQATADFLLRFNREFFDNETNQKIITAIEENNPLLKENNGEFTCYQIDDYLGYYELMAHYEKKRFIDFEMIDEMFGHYISLAYQNQEIKKYIVQLRNETGDARYYKPFADLANRVIEIEKKIRSSNSSFDITNK